MKIIIKTVIMLMVFTVKPLLANYEWKYEEYTNEGSSYHKSFIVNKENSILGIQCIKNKSSNNLLIILVQNEFDFNNKNESAIIVVNNEEYKVDFNNHKKNGNVLMIDVSKIKRDFIKELLWDAYFSKKITIKFKDVYFEFKTKQSSKTLNKMLDDCLI
jgi:hypothetical protein